MIARRIQSSTHQHPASFKNKGCPIIDTGQPSIRLSTIKHNHHLFAYRYQYQSTKMSSFLFATNLLNS